MVLLRGRILCCLVLSCLLAAVCYGQDSSQPHTANVPNLTVSKSTSATPADQRVVLKVGDQQITQAAFEQLVRDLAEQQGAVDITAKAFAENYSSLLMLSQQAKAHQLENTPEVQRQLAIDRTQILSNAEFARLKQAATPSPEQVKAYYDAHLDDYDVVDLRRIFVWVKTADSKDAHGLPPQEAQKLADQIRHAYESDGDASKVVPNPNDAAVDADALHFQRGELPAPMETVAFSLKPGEWGKVENTPGALIYLQAVRRGRRELKDVAPSIEKILRGEKLKAELEQLKQQTGIWMDEAYFGAGQKSASEARSVSGERTKERGEE